MKLLKKSLVLLLAAAMVCGSFPAVHADSDQALRQTQTAARSVIQEKEPNNDPAIAMPIPVPASVHGSFKASNIDVQKDFYTFRITQKCKIRISGVLHSPNAGFNVSMDDGPNTILASSKPTGQSASGQEYRRELTVILTPGKYYTNFSSLGDASEYDFDLEVVELMAPDPSDPVPPVTDDPISVGEALTASSAIPIKLGQKYVKKWTFDSVLDGCYVKFTTPADGYLTFRFDHVVKYNNEPVSIEFRLSNRKDGEIFWRFYESDPQDMKDYYEYLIPVPQGDYCMCFEPSGAASREVTVKDSEFCISFTEADHWEKEPNGLRSKADQVHLGETYHAIADQCNEDQYDYFQFDLKHDADVVLLIDNYEEFDQKSGRIDFIDADNQEEMLMETSVNSFDYHRIRYYKDGVYWSMLPAKQGANYIRTKLNSRNHVPYSITLYIHEHQYGTQWHTNEHFHWRECICGKEIDREYHAYSDTWTYDAQYHWKECKCGMCDEKKPHSFSDRWKYDDEYHWKACECGMRREEQPHQFYEQIRTEPTETEPGEKVIRCRGCNYYKSVEIPPTGDSSRPSLPDTRPPENPFTDISADDYYFTPVIWAVRHGITAGMTDTEFGPEIPCARAHAMTFLWSAEGKPRPGTSSLSFIDVPSGEYYAKAVMWAVEHQITSGVSENRFGPDETCTRGQIVTFLWKAAGSPASTLTVNPFRDVRSSDYFYDAVLWAVENGITSGMSTSLFGPEESCTRGQIVTFLYKNQLVKLNHRPAAPLLRFHGSGNDVITGINLPRGPYLFEYKYTGKYGFRCEFFYTDEDSHYAAIDHNSCTGRTLLTYALEQEIQNGKITVDADGDWEIAILPVAGSVSTNLTGEGNWAGGCFTVSRDLQTIVQYAASGRSNFIVEIYELNGRSMIAINEIAPCSGKDYIQLEAGKKYIITVSADGPWAFDLGLGDPQREMELDVFRSRELHP